MNVLLESEKFWSEEFTNKLLEHSSRYFTGKIVIEIYKLLPCEEIYDLYVENGHLWQCFSQKLETDNASKSWRIIFIQLSNGLKK